MEKQEVMDALEAIKDKLIDIKNDKIKKSLLELSKLFSKK